MEVILCNYNIITIIMHYIFTPIEGKALFFFQVTLKVLTVGKVGLEQYNHAQHLHHN